MLVVRDPYVEDDFSAGTDHNIMPIDDRDAFPPYVEPLMQWLEAYVAP